MIAFLESKDLHKISTAAGSQADFDYIKDEVKKGRSRFVNILGVYFVLRVDGNALTVVCAQGKNLKAASYWVVRKRPALQRLLKHCNFNFFETAPSGYAVYRMVLNG